MFYILVQSDITYLLFIPFIQKRKYLLLILMTIMILYKIKMQKRQTQMEKPPRTASSKVSGLNILTKIKAKTKTMGGLIND